jgi:NAD+ diphosphatase
MWPLDPDGFEPDVTPGGDADHGESWMFLTIRGQLASIAEQGIPRPITADELRWLDLDVRARHYLGRFRGRDCFALHAEGRLPEGYALSDLRGWLGRVEPAVFYLAGRAKQIVEWHDTHRYCGRCGTETEDHAQDRAKVCPSCGVISYPRLSPSIIVLVTRGQEMLLARNANWPTNMYSTLAGFVEPGESIEQTVHREVHEEVGIRVRNLRYLGSQSWPFPNSLMLGFHAEYQSGDIVCQEGEIADAQWFRFDELPNVPPGTAISRWLIDDFIAQVKPA